ncbi:hypothetical protein FRB98_005818 [Tulasnella sp. 332]|nr:hypothetical protein FRB98_005818 [Tulasnella sp. 332]
MSPIAGSPLQPSQTTPLSEFLGPEFTNYTTYDWSPNHFLRLFDIVIIFFFILVGFSLVSLAFCAFQLNRMASRRRGLAVLPWNRRSSNIKRDRSSHIKFDESRRPSRRDTRSTSPTSSLHSAELSEAEFGEVMHAQRVSVTTASPSLRNTPSPENSQHGRNPRASAAVTHENRITPELGRVPEQAATEEFAEYMTPTRSQTAPTVRFLLSPPTPAPSPPSGDSPEHEAPVSRYNASTTASANGAELLDVSLDSTPSSSPANNVAEWRRSLTLSDLMLDPQIPLSRPEETPTPRRDGSRTLAKRILPRLRSISALSSSIGQSLFWSPSSPAQDQTLQTPATTFFGKSLYSSTLNRVTGGAAQTPTTAMIRPSISQPFDVKMEARDHGFELLDLDPAVIRANQDTLPSNKKPAPDYIPVRSRSQFDQFGRQRRDELQEKHIIQKTRPFDDGQLHARSAVKPATFRRVSLLESEFGQLTYDPFRRATPPITSRDQVHQEACAEALLHCVQSPTSLTSTPDDHPEQYEPDRQPGKITMERLVGSMMSTKRNTQTTSSSLSNRASSLQSRYDITCEHEGPRSHFSPPETPSPHPLPEEDDEEQDVTDVFGKGGGASETGFWQKLGQGFGGLTLNTGRGTSSPSPLPTTRLRLGRKPIPSSLALSSYSGARRPVLQSQSQSRRDSSNGNIRHAHSGSLASKVRPKQLITGLTSPHHLDSASKRSSFSRGPQTPYRPPRRESLQLRNMNAVAEILDVAFQKNDDHDVTSASGSESGQSQSVPLRLSDFPAPPSMLSTFPSSGRILENEILRPVARDRQQAVAKHGYQRQDDDDLATPPTTMAPFPRLSTIPSFQNLAQKYPQTSTPTKSTNERNRVTVELE